MKTLVCKITCIYTTLNCVSESWILGAAPYLTLARGSNISPDCDNLPTLSPRAALQPRCLESNVCKRFASRFLLSGEVPLLEKAATNLSGLVRRKPRWPPRLSLCRAGCVHAARCCCVPVSRLCPCGAGCAHGPGSWQKLKSQPILRVGGACGGPEF